MNIKNRINASRAAYRKVKSYQTKNSLHLRDLINSQLTKNEEILQKAERSLDKNDLKIPLL